MLFCCADNKLIGYAAFCAMILLPQMYNFNLISGIPDTETHDRRHGHVDTNPGTIKYTITWAPGLANTCVMFSVPGLVVPVKLALDLTFPFQPNEMVLQEPLPRSRADMDRVPHILIAVTTACCQQISRNRRKAIRNTWLSISREMMPDVEVNFFLAQARNASVLREWVATLEVNMLC